MSKYKNSAIEIYLMAASVPMSLTVLVPLFWSGAEACLVTDVTHMRLHIKVTLCSLDLLFDSCGAIVGIVLIQAFTVVAVLSLSVL